MIVVVCPGQGSQTPGFLSPWLEEPARAAKIAELSVAAGIDLEKHGTVSDAETIRDTAVAQPLIVAAGVLVLDALLAKTRGAKIGGFAGHSVGEITAAVAAGVLTDIAAMRFVAARGREMADAARQGITGMSAVIGADQEELLAKLDSLGLQPANFNGGGQIVAAGPVAALDALKENPPTGARVIPLQVAGAFHTPYMQPTVAGLKEVADSLSPADPNVMLWTNRDGGVVTSGSKFVELLVGQVSSPVRWDLCMKAFADAGVTGLIEIAPAGALVGLAKRGLKGVPTVAVRTPEDLAAASEMIAGAQPSVSSLTESVKL